MTPSRRRSADELAAGEAGRRRARRRPRPWTRWEVTRVIVLRKSGRTEREIARLIAGWLVGEVPKLAFLTTR